MSLRKNQSTLSFRLGRYKQIIIRCNPPQRDTKFTCGTRRWLKIRKTIDSATHRKPCYNQKIILEKKHKSMTAALNLYHSQNFQVTIVKMSPTFCMTGITNHMVQKKTELKIIHTSKFSYHSMRQVDALPVRTDMYKNWGG